MGAGIWGREKETLCIDKKELPPSLAPVCEPLVLENPLKAGAPPASPFPSPRAFIPERAHDAACCEPYTARV